MSTSTHQSLADIRRGNVRAAIDAVYAQTHPVVVTDLVTLTGLSRPTLTLTMRSMVDNGMVVAEQVRPPSGIGRPMIRYRPMPDHHSVLAVRIGSRSFEFALADVFGEVYAARRLALEEGELGAQMGAALRNFLTEATGPVSACVLAAMGIVHRGQVVRSNTHPTLQNPETLEAIRQPLRERWPDAEFAVRNDAKLAAGWLHRRVGNDGARSHYAVAVQMSDAGMGCGIVVAGEVLDGAHGAAGEVGIEQAGPWAQAESELQNAEERLGLARVDIFRDARRGDRTSRDVTHRVMGYVARGVRPLILALDPDTVILGGEIAEAGDALRDVLDGQITELGLTPPRILIVEQSTDAVIQGALGAALDLARDTLAEGLITE